MSWRDHQKFPKKVLKHVALVLAVFLCLSAVSLGLNFWVYHELQARLKIRMEGKYVPYIFIPSFKVKQGSFTWEDRVRLVEGNFKVTFDPLTLISRRGIRIILKSKGSKIQFIGSWAEQQGIERVTVDYLIADIILGRRGLAGINEVEVRSPSFQFSLKNADKGITPKA
ncbi:MAG TPA: hypothetical protein P5561_02015 [Candidatus Omnitrophota bacterium]|nr:hypothetical protein [Candidatus Omnitrophota bacterium]HRY85291.1 hypothetical protein [Candidatus Omnitrophota bacterium]